MSAARRKPDDSHASHPQSAGVRALRKLVPPPVERETFRVLARWQLVAGVVGMVATAAFVVLGLGDPPQLMRCYLAAYLPCFNVSLGCVVMLIIYHLTGGGWGWPIRRILEAGARTLPFVAIAFVPIALGLKHIYLWADPELVESNELLTQQKWWTNPEFFWIRAAVYFFLWLSIAFFLNRWSRLQDRREEWTRGRWLTNLAAGGAVIYGITIHFTGLDWIISLQPSYHSTITGPMLATQQLLSSMAMVVLVVAALWRRPPLRDVVSPKLWNDWGNLLLTFVVLFSYMLWFEFMLTWLANMRADVVWYSNRLRHGWKWALTGLAVLHFVVPFLLLLQRSVKRSPRWLAGVAALCLVMQVLFTHVQVLPAFAASDHPNAWLSLLAAPGFVGLWVVLFIWQIRSGGPLLTRADPNALLAMHVRESDQWEEAWEESLVHG